MNDRRPVNIIWLISGVEPPPTAAGHVKRDWYALMDAFPLEFATPTYMGDHESLEAEES